MFIDQDIRFREQAAQGTTTFLGSQLQDAMNRLNEQDARLAQFKESTLVRSQMIRKPISVFLQH